MEKLVSVILPVYNAEKYIFNTLNSAINQTYKNIEIIIINDCSTDDSLKIVNSINDSRIKVVNLKNNKGVSNARNKGLEIAKGEYIAFLDSDDIWTSDKLRLQIEFMKKNDYKLSFTAYSISKNNKKVKEVSVPTEVDYMTLLKGNKIALFTSVISRELAAKFKFTNIKHEDYDYWLQITKEYKGYGLNEDLGIYNKRDDSLSSDKFKAATWQWKIYSNEKLGLISKIKYFILYAINGIKKHS